ncbi:hypothetical protein HHL11_12100 [Ramlibacter sp. G-1-2-2]|uniref:DUF5666 domain-containing protein n=1 Tax=Ramlibacter agri TaxID=2728837 RepID=A0A848HA60_9BURK|nr:DUF5666 domain-containing protein [Ramlibacter agri]NML44498.1 hypothetical protein [Ramlibacter agri]
MKETKLPAWAARHLLPAGLALAVAAGLAGCGGGGGGGGDGGTTTPAPAAAASTMSSGVITAFGSVFVNGHRFHTDSARVIDDDTGAVSTSATGLEVGMVVDVKHKGRDDDPEAEAEELHTHPLARGFVDASDATNATITVMGQKVQLTSGTGFSDRRACVTAATSPCTPVTSASGLVATTVTGTGTTTTTPGNYVTVNGFLFDSGATPTSSNVVATLVSVSDAPAGNSPANFKVEGVISVATTGTGTATVTTATIGNLRLDLSKAACRAAGVQVNCANAFVTGEVVSAGATAAPALPATVLVADFARKVSKAAVEDAGATVEVEGVVSAVTGTSTFVVRGLAIDTSGLPAGTTLPKVGDEVRVAGTLSTDGSTVQATTLSVEDEAREAKLALQGQALNVVPGATTTTFTLTVLGQAITVNASTRLKDLSIAGWDRRDPTANPFNITTFQAYLAASVSKTVLVVAEQGTGAALVAKSLTILPASTVAAIAGPVDASPAPVNSTVSGTPTVFFVHGVKVGADPAAVTTPGRKGTTPTLITAGDQVIAVGTFTGGAIVVGPVISNGNRVLDLGLLLDDDHGGGHSDDDGHRHNRGMF